MAYKQFVPLPNLNFQFNRVSMHGEEACKEEELWEIAPRLHKFDVDAWYREWHGLALRAESEGRLMHGAFYHRMSEFFLPDHRQEKTASYQDFRRCFYRAVDETRFETFEIPYDGKALPALRFPAPEEKRIVVLHGGFDSFIEEFYFTARTLAGRGYTVILFEGPGQGRTLREGLKMTYRWERPVSAVLDYFRVDLVCLIGVSLGGYLALRAAAFEPRIVSVVAYDVVWDALAALTRYFPEELARLVVSGDKKRVNEMMTEFRKTNDMVDWMVSHGMYITGTETPFDYLHTFTDFSTRDISPRLKQDVLLLAGENDHFVPAEFYRKQKDALINARSVSGHLYTAEEGGDQHCQIDDMDKVWRDILEWLDGLDPAVSPEQIAAS